MRAAFPLQPQLRDSTGSGTLGELTAAQAATPVQTSPGSSQLVPHLLVAEHVRPRVRHWP